MERQRPKDHDNLDGQKSLGQDKNTTRYDIRVVPSCRNNFKARRKSRSSYFYQRN
ncbi:hypothetical protein FOPG_18362 [Fusarium oxysporum f. sp. conglutinans race 2 54008]|uniref:Uncharacterized protein n=1 Tax=Fusarium oxysporum f. sp. conglutinans race 2 54008 TaxID=1089457 RepID=X0GZX1_FUSOX|nr:hypothetical protein FOPG_18362 [Fusarium oxysporum f. sp. conglutinans race 2 54008]